MRKYIALLLMITLTGTFTACSDDAAEAPTTSRVVTYEITGNYTGKLTIIYNDNVSGNTVLNDITLPWSVEVVYSANVLTIGMGAQSTVAMGSAGQMATMKILLNGKVVKSATSTTGSLGEIVLPTFAYTF